MVYLSRIYTKSGDDGSTGLGDGSRVPKDSDRVEAYGTVDELNSVLGVLLSLPEDNPERSLLESISNDLFDVGADLCSPMVDGEKPGDKLRVTADQVERLERAIDRLNADLAPLRSFILPGGLPAPSWLHLARSVCRRAERRVVTLTHSEAINRQALIYLNRLSDLLFVMARAMNGGGAGDVLWKPGKTQSDSSDNENKDKDKTT